MDVSQAVAERRSIRAFSNEPVATETLTELLVKASRAPSGGNVQPWRIFLVNGERMQDFRSHLSEWTEPETPAYRVYPEGLKEPYRSSRFKCGEDMYALLGISRDDKPARYARLAENFDCFGAPAAIFCYFDRQMGPPQWSDLGMFLQTFMLLATEAGIDTCAQEAWAAREKCVSAFLDPADELRLFCGVAIGYRDTSAPVNRLVTDREPASVWLEVV
ncbi:NADH dehydrogenase [Oceanicola sp. 22II-s10i]|uniref:nitroreductase n=1 Tax=Oceanicola sp. 22II-s10i TaxID=1317116 RepID=UPI000B52335E|nr:nitroreductase [Oceanicola sp. 22II-s10i]OWU84047.1 NADH dehydrogenase [Oceanicola sp. 22II-s10i]